MIHASVHYLKSKDEFSGEKYRSICQAVKAELTYSFHNLHTCNIIIVLNYFTLFFFHFSRGPPVYLKMGFCLIYYGGDFDGENNKITRVGEMFENKNRSSSGEELISVILELYFKLQSLKNE